MRRFYAVYAALTCGTVFCTVMARAQDNGLPGPQPLDMSSVILNSTMLKIRMDNHLGTGSRGHSIPHKGGIGSHTARNANTTFHSSPAVSARVRKQYLDWVKTRSPQEAESLKTVFAQHNPTTMWGQIVHEDGLRPGDASDALASYWILNYLIANQSKDSTGPQAKAVRNQVRSAMLANPAFARLTNAQKQEVAETWMVNFVVQQGVYGDAMKRGDTQLLQKLADAAVARFQNEMHIDLRSVRLTDSGFVPKRG